MSQIKKIAESEILEAGVSSLTSRPSSPTAYGGDGLTATELKARFDRLPRLIADRVNALIGLLLATPELSDLSGGSAVELLQTGMFPGEREEHTLADLLRELLDGSAAEYIGAGAGKSVAEALRERVRVPRIVTGGQEIMLGEDCEVRAGRISTATVRLPASHGDSYAATLVFESLPADGATSISFPGGILWSGDDVTGGSFVPRGGKHYTCRFWYDGGYQATVRGVSYAS